MPRDSRPRYAAGSAVSFVRIETTLFEGAPAPQPGGVLVPDPTRAGHGLEFRADAADGFRIG
jgi:hypothetical protein